MKNKGLFFLRKSFVKKRRFEKIRKQFYTDDKFLRKFKKAKNKLIDTNEYKVTDTDPIENFFFAPKSVRDKINEINDEQELEDNTDTNSKRKEREESNKKKEHAYEHIKGKEIELDEEKTQVSNISKHVSTNHLNKKQKENNDSDDNDMINNKNRNSEENKEKKKENEFTISDIYGRPLKKKSPYSKQLTYAMTKKEELEQIRKEKQTLFSKWDAERKEKKILKYKKYKKLSRKTKKGQPIMDNIVKHLLEKI